jgi:hypothetical protein
MPDFPSVSRKDWPLALLLSLALSGCGGNYVTVRVPPQVDLRAYEAIGVIELASGDAALGRYATERLQSSLQSAQPGTRLLELGTEQSVLAAVGASRLDAEAIKKIGAKFGVVALFQGNLSYSNPKVKIGGLTDMAIAQGGVRADLRGDMFLKLLETKTAASVWSNSSWATRKLGDVRLSSGGVSGSVQSLDPQREMVPDLVREVTTGLRETTQRQRVD